MKNWKNIFKKEEPLTDDELLNYLKDQVDSADIHELEEKIAASDLNMDALEGLSAFKDKSSLAKTTQLLNQQLKKQISKSATKRRKRKPENQQWIIVVTLAVLLLSIIGYFLIHYSR